MIAFATHSMHFWQVWLFTMVGAIIGFAVGRISHDR